MNPVYANAAPADLSAYDNRVMREIESRAEDEIAKNDDFFAQWVCEHRDTADLARLISLTFGTHANAAYFRSEMLEMIRKDYVDYRIEHAKGSGEWDDTAQELADDEREAA